MQSKLLEMVRLTVLAKVDEELEFLAQGEGWGNLFPRKNSRIFGHGDASKHQFLPMTSDSLLKLQYL